MCPVCLGLPGVSPVFNEEVLNLAIKAALALGCKVSSTMKFDRKNYYYPDLPKNFQISQYDMPLASDGSIKIMTDGKAKKIRIKRTHLEEDAGKLIHEKNASLVDLNRTGLPLLEIVSEPDITSPEEAYQYLVNLKAILQYLEVSDCNMEEGSLRCDANISIRPEGEKKLGTKTEIKNMNTFKGVKAALEYENKRQNSLLEKGKKITQETRLYDSAKEVTISMRSKEEAHDYKYFPEPDLVPFEVEETRLKTLKESLPELPEAKSERFKKDYTLSDYDVSILVSDRKIADYFEECVSLFKKPKIIANWITQDLAAEMNARGITIEKLKLKPQQLVNMIEMIESGLVSGKIAKDILKVMLDTGKDPKQIVNEKGLTQVSSEDDIRKVVKEIMLENKRSVDDYRSGKKKAAAHLIGQVMKKTKGKANPKVLNTILEEELNREEA